MYCPPISHFRQQCTRSLNFMHPKFPQQQISEADSPRLRPRLVVFLLKPSIQKETRIASYTISISISIVSLRI